MKKDFPRRKHPRLDGYDYSAAGAYFITICTQDRRCVLSCIVGRGLALAEMGAGCGDGGSKPPPYGCGEMGAVVEYTVFGKIAEKQLFLLEERYPHLTIEQYVIMPDHVHAIMVLTGEEAGAGHRPTVTDIVCAYKSLTTRECKKNGLEGKLFQTSFYEHIIRDREDHEEIAKYIHENPLRLYYGK